MIQSMSRVVFQFPPSSANLFQMNLGSGLEHRFLKQKVQVRMSAMPIVFVFVGIFEFPHDSE